ncbi:MAG: DNA-methyltransferase [Chitinophagales bacterium]
MAGRTKTASFGTTRRESHDATSFYGRQLYGHGLPGLLIDCLLPPAPVRSVAPRPLAEWADRIYCGTAEDLSEVPDGSVGLAFTSPPYNAGKDFDADLDLAGYFALIKRVADEVYRTLLPGGRYVVNIANLGRKPYVPLHAYFHAIHAAAGFMPAGEIIWRKAKGMNSSCAWGTWRSAKAPRLRDLHEYLLVFAKERFDRPERGESGISAEEFMAGTLSVWDVATESAKRVGHPAPFPVELAGRVIKVFSYEGDVVLDPFCGSGTTCVAAARSGRHYVGYDIVEQYCALAQARLTAAKS